MKKTSTPKEVAKAIKHDLLEERNLSSLMEVATVLGKEPQSIYNLMKGIHRISYRNAKQLHDVFGYSISFLTKGEGELYESFDEPGRAVLDSVGMSTISREGLSEREAYLNDYCHIYERLLSLVNKLFEGRKRIVKEDIFFYPTREMDKITSVFRTTEERDRMRDILLKYALIQSLIDPMQILQELRELEKNG